MNRPFISSILKKLSKVESFPIIGNVFYYIRRKVFYILLIQRFNFLPAKKLNRQQHESKDLLKNITTTFYINTLPFLAAQQFVGSGDLRKPEFYRNQPTGFYPDYDG